MHIIFFTINRFKKLALGHLLIAVQSSAFIPQDEQQVAASSSPFLSILLFFLLLLVLLEAPGMQSWPQWKKKPQTKNTQLGHFTPQALHRFLHTPLEGWWWAKEIRVKEIKTLWGQNRPNFCKTYYHWQDHWQDDLQIFICLSSLLDSLLVLASISLINYTDATRSSQTASRSPAMTSFNIWINNLEKVSGKEKTKSAKAMNFLLV